MSPGRPMPMQLLHLPLQVPPHGSVGGLIGPDGLAASKRFVLPPGI